MTKGKHASAADARRARDTAESEVVAGRRKIVQLTNENRELRDSLTSLQLTQIADMKRMRLLLAEGAAPEVAALKQKIAQLEESAGAVHAKNELIQTNWDKASERLFRHFRVVHGMADGDIWTELMRWIGNDNVTVTDPTQTAKNLSSASIIAIDLAQGKRTRGHILASESSPDGAM